MSRLLASAAITVLAVTGPALAQKPADPNSANPPGKQMQDTFTPDQRGANKGASTFVPQSPPGQAARPTTPGNSATAPGKVK